MSGVIPKTLRANSACLRVDIEVGIGRAGNTSLSVPDRLVKGAGISSQRSTGGVLADALQLAVIESVASGAANTLSLTIVPVGELRAAFAGQSINVPIVGSCA